MLPTRSSSGRNLFLVPWRDRALFGTWESNGPVDPKGGETAARLFAKVKSGGSFGYASVFPDGVSATNPTVKVTRVFAQPDASKVREFADDIRDGKFVLPISQRLPLQDAAKAHALVQKGGAGKIILVIRDAALQ